MWLCSSHCGTWVRLVFSAGFGFLLPAEALKVAGSRTPGHLSARTPGSYGRNLRGLLGGGWAPRSRPSTLCVQEAPLAQVPCWAWGDWTSGGPQELPLEVAPRHVRDQLPARSDAAPSPAARHPGPARSARLTFSSISGTTNHLRGRSTRLCLPFELKRTHPLINGLTLLFIIHENTLLGSGLLKQLPLAVRKVGGDRRAVQPVHVCCRLSTGLCPPLRPQ